MKSEENTCHWAHTLKCIFLKENFDVFIQISLKFIPKGPFDDKSAFVLVIVGPQALT